MFTRRAKLGVNERVRRLENLVLALVGKVKKMAEGQARFEQSFKTLQEGVAHASRDLRANLQDLVAAHDSGDQAQFEAHAQRAEEFLSSFDSLGQADNQATKAGVSPTTTSGRSTGDLPQGRGPLAQENTATGGPQSRQTNENAGIAGSAGDQPRASQAGGDQSARRASQDDGDKEHDVLVRGRDVPD